MTGRPLVCFDGVMDAAKSGGWRVFTSTLKALVQLDAVRLAAIVPADRVREVSDLPGVNVVPVHVSPAQPLRNIAWHATRLAALVSRIGADVLHVPTHNLLVARKVCPTVVTIHDVTEFHLKGHYDPLRTLYRRLVVPRNARLADRIVTVSQWAGADISRTLRVPPDRIVVAPNGVDPSFRPVPRQEAERQVWDAFRMRPPYVLYVGQIHMPNKNLVRLVDAFARIRRDLPGPTRLVLAGKEVSRAEDVRAAVRRAGLTGVVHWLGYVPDGALPSLYSAADVFCYPSLQEGFGLPVLEAMSCGTPVLTSNTTALAEVAGEAAVLVNPERTDELSGALRQLLTDESLRAALRDAGFRRSREYGWDRTAATLAVIYRELTRLR